ncbi:NAD-dependent epimerase/dehydratase family protein [Nocardioides humilatus]|uniref:NAD-dependent epimerase/dehydratase family protein n=1 Tax=Nocardioides humilatus TaxID=2607660 RepID=A0A5B1LFU5_9ACTN|nr:NAD-dependent epimerase/dehydratase family protein [Nocardioides humilatus]KAA1418517.1 NAD-dependent epimerase/dehydratase family protein [Nocardioides humilatus]
MKRVLITGGAGFIGVHLADRLTRDGVYDVTVLDNESLGDRSHLDLDRVRFVEGDLRDRDAVRRALEGQDAVVHLAAHTRVIDSIVNPAHNFDNNVIGTFNVLEGCRELGVGRVVAASTGGAIVGDVPPPVHERMAAQPTSPYGASKLMMEGYLSAYAGAYGISTCSLRFSNVYGPRSYHKGSVVAHFFKQIIAGEELVVYGDGSQARDFLYVGDLVEGIRVAVDSDAVGAFQLGSGKPTTVNELLELMRDATGLDLDVRYEDFRTGEVRYTWCDIDKAREGMGFDPVTPLDVGIRQTWEWFVNHRAQHTARP